MSKNIVALNKIVKKMSNLEVSDTEDWQKQAMESIDQVAKMIDNTDIEVLHTKISGNSLLDNARDYIYEKIATSLSVKNLDCDVNQIDVVTSRIPYKIISCKEDYFMDKTTDFFIAPIIDAMIKKGFDLEFPMHDNLTPLTFAINNGLPHSAVKFIVAGCDTSSLKVGDTQPDYMRSSYITPLLQSIKEYLPSLLKLKKDTAKVFKETHIIASDLIPIVLEYCYSMDNIVKLYNRLNTSYQPPLLPALTLEEGTDYYIPEEVTTVGDLPSDGV